MLPRTACRDHRGHHPWRYAGDHLPDWRIELVGDLPPGRWGLTLHAEQRILIRAGLTQAERRCTLAHETGHVLRGPASRCRRLAEETLVDRQAARLLLPSVRRVGHALVWHLSAGGNHDDAAEDLWVDDELLEVRLSTLAPRDRAWLNDQLGTVVLP